MIVCQLIFLLNEPTILQLLVAYRSAIARNVFELLEGRLVYYDPVPTVTNHTCRIVVPLSFCRTIFTLMHATHVARYIGEYKTLHRIKLRFFWYQLRSDVAEWIKNILTICSPIDSVDEVKN